MPIVETVLFAPPLRNANLSEPIQKWLLSIQNLHPLEEADTTAGNLVFTLPPAGLNAATGQSNQNREYICMKVSADANTFTINGAAGGPVVLAANGAVARFKSNGTLWRRVA